MEGEGVHQRSLTYRGVECMTVESWLNGGRVVCYPDRFFTRQFILGCDTDLFEKSIILSDPRALDSPEFI